MEKGIIFQSPWSDFRGRLILNQVDSKIIIPIDEIPYRMVINNKTFSCLCVDGYYKALYNCIGKALHREDQRKVYSCIIYPVILNKSYLQKYIGWLFV